MAFINLLEIVYPVGSIYITTTEVSPAESIGGTWEQIKGCVLAGGGSNGYEANIYGGSLKITTSNMPSHTHAAPVYDEAGGTYYFNTSRSFSLDCVARYYAGGSSSDSRIAITSKTTESDSIGNSDLGQSKTTAATGSGTNYLPYYYGVYIYKRTA